MYQQMGPGAQTPPWAATMLEEIQSLKTDIQSIKQFLPKLDNIEKNC